MSTHAWNNAYHELWRQAAAHRGLREATGDLPGHMLYQRLRQWPRTCGGDALAIAAIVDPVLCAAPLESGGFAVERKWRRCTSELADAALGDPGAEYAHNRTFWSAVASTLAYLASVDAPVPEPLWSALLADLASAEHLHRNAAWDRPLYVEAHRYDELWRAQKTALAKLRGADVREASSGVMGGRMTIPRTTNADALQLGNYWYHALAHVELSRVAMGPEGEHVLQAAGLASEIRRALPLFADLDNFATGKDPSALYPKNESLWRGTASLAVTLAVIDEAPIPFAMHPGTATHAIERRNASYPGAGTFETMWDKQHDDFVEARGFDSRDAPKGQVGRTMKIPRTLNAEILQLAGYWDAAWKKLEGRRGILGSLPTEQGLDGQKTRWEAVMSDVTEIAQRGKVDEVYPKNHEFWREAHTLAVTLDLFKELPTKADIAIDVAKTLPDRFANVVSDIANALGDIAHKAASGVTSGLGKPILIGGSVLLGGILLWRWTRPKRTEAA